MTSILIVDDDALLRRAIGDRLHAWGHIPEAVETGEQAIRVCKRKHFDLILLDLKRRGSAGISTLRQLRQNDCPSEVVVLTACGSLEAAVEAIKNGASDYLPKPADFELLRNVIDRVVKSQRLARVAAARTPHTLEDSEMVIGESDAMHRAVDTARRAARANTTVLLRGESGVGKQVFAEYIHRKSQRQEGPFVYVNCVAINGNLIESELFGHMKGAFTSAVATKPGKFDAAEGGTIFLDEVGDVSPEFQAKLLHFLEKKQYERVGGSQTISVDCRVIAATNRALEEAVKDGAFREDLFYRLNIIDVEIPPLRERRADIVALAERFVRAFAMDQKRRPPKLAARTAEIITAYRWPGNVRQLRNAMERMVVLASTDTLTPDLLPPEVWQSNGAANLATDILPLREAVAEFKRQYVARILSASDGNQTRAATRLGVQRTFLNRFIKQHQIGVGARAN